VLYYLLEMLWWVFCFLRCIVSFDTWWVSHEAKEKNIPSGCYLGSPSGCVVHCQCRSLLRLLPGWP
jgi:hypothetical protein